MRSHIWAIEQLIDDMMLIDAYILLKSLNLHADQFYVVGLNGKYTLRRLIDEYNLTTRKLEDIKWRICFLGGPIGDHYVASMKHYVVDRVLQAILTQGAAKVAKVFDEISCLTT